MKSPSWIRRVRRPLALLAVLLVAAQPALATWSIVAVDTRTGEVCVASATCLPNFGLKANLAVVKVGVGAAAAQSLVDTTAANRIAIWNGFGSGTPPELILQGLSMSDPGHQSRQYGIVDMAHGPVTFTGTGAGAGKGGVQGVDGTIRYAIQGNVLTGPQVVLAAEQAFLMADGDLSQRVMAGMEAARALGGDGRCSCDITFPTSCGVPPPSFTKSAHVAFIVLARIGDVDGTCEPFFGCANGDYWLDLRFRGKLIDPDPILMLQTFYDGWRARLAGRPDHLRTVVEPRSFALQAGPASAREVVVELKDLEGALVGHGGFDLQLRHLGPGAPVTTPGPVFDEGNGRYRFTLSAGSQAGSDTWRLHVGDGQGRITLYPDVHVQVAP